MSGSRRIDGWPTPLSEPRRTSTSGGPGRSPAVRARVGRLLDGGAEGVVARTPYPPEGPGPARDGALRGADDEPRTDEGRETSGLRARERRTEPPRPRFHPQSEDACRTSPRAPGFRIHAQVTRKSIPEE